MAFYYMTTARFRLANLRSCRIGKLSNMRRKNMQDASTWQKVFKDLDRLPTKAMI